MPVQDIRTLVEIFYERLWNEWEDGLVDDVLSEDFHFKGSLGPVITGRDAWRSYRDGIRQGAPDFHNEVLETIVEGERAAVRLRYSGTHTGNLFGRPPTGRRFSYEGTAFFTRENDRLTRGWVLGDRVTLDEQLGTVTPPAMSDPGGHAVNGPSLVSWHSAPHYVWGSGCDGWRLVDRNDLSVIEERMPAGAAETPHRHERARQLFFILDGTATLLLPGGALRIRAGEAADVPPRVVHQMTNASSDELRFLVISCPSTRGDRTPAALAP